MVTKVKGTKGSKGKNGAHPTAGGNGTDATFTQNGLIGADSITVQVTGGDGRAGGKGTGSANGATGGNGGNASGTLDGNIFNAPATTTLTVSLTSTGGDGGAGGAGVLPGAQGNGGNGTVAMNGNIIQPSKTMGAITLDAFAVGGTGAQDGNATATMNGNIVQVTKATSVTLDASASTDDPSDNTTRDGNASFGSKNATVDGNIVSGNVTNVTLEADAFWSNASATLSGNIVQDTAASGKDTLEATGQHIDIENNKVTIGKGQELDLTVNELSPAYDATIKGNTFAGAGSNNMFVFTDNGISGTGTPTPSATPDAVVIDLGNNSFMFDGKNNKLQNFTGATVMGNNVNATLTGTAGNDILIGSGGNDTFIATTGTDTYNGGGGSNTVSYANGTGPNGVTVNLGLEPAQQPIGGGFGPDTLINIQNVIGTNFNDTLTAGADTSTLNGGLGDDLLVVGTGADTLIGGGGNDTASFANFATGVNISLLVAGPQSDGPGSVTLNGISNLTGGSGHDTLTAAGGTTTLNGGLGDDTLVVGTGTDTLIGGGGNDTASFANFTTGVDISLQVAGSQSDGPGSVTLSGISNLTGGSGNDTLTAGAGPAILIGGAGNDTLNGNGVNTTASFIDSAAGVTANLLTGTATGDGNDTLNGISNLTGSAFNDTLTAGAGAGTLIGGGGNDTLNGNGVNTTASFIDSAAGVTANLLTGTATGDGNDTLNGISNLTGSAFNDTLTAGAGPAILIGGAGNDTLIGGSGNNILFGGSGANTITGGVGGLNVAYYAGSEWQYTNPTLTSVNGGPAGDTSTDTLSNIDRLKFLSPSQVSDMNYDGYGDLVFQNTDGDFQIRLQGAGLSQTVQTMMTGGGFSSWKAVGTGQITPGPYASVLVQQSGTGQLAVFSDLGSGVGFGFTSLGPGFTGWTAITTGDFNGDAASDVLLQNTTTGAAEIAFVNAVPGEFASVNAITAITSPGLGWKAISSGDFNGDGDSDILWQNSTTGALDASLMNGATGTPTAVGNPGTGYTAVGTGDFNGDGMSDILLANQFTSNAQIWLMNGTTKVGSLINVTGPGAGWTLLGAEDINRDGFSDLLWQNSTTGNVMAQEMTTGGTPLGGLVSLGAPGSAFHLVASTGGG